MTPAKSPRERADMRFGEMMNARTGFETSWRSIGEKLIPYRMRLDHQSLRGDIKDSQIYNSRPRLALRTLAAMIMSGITSPARMWFNLGIEDRDLAKFKPVRKYLEDYRDRTAAALQISNFYKCVSSATWIDLPSICTAVNLMEERLGKPLRFIDSPPGEYYLDINEDGEVDTCGRRRVFNSRQAMAKWGNACPKVVRDAYDQCNYKTEFEFRQLIQPLAEGEPEPGLLQTGKTYASRWWLKGVDADKGFVHEGGFYRFPVLAPRWQSMSDCPYGYGPGWDQRADNGMLQHLELQKINITDKLGDPVTKVKGQVTASSLLPGAVWHLPAGADSSAEPLYEVNPASLPAIRELIQDAEGHIDEVFMTHLSQLFMLGDTDRTKTATEVNAQLGERAQNMGPVLESLNDEFLEPLVEGVAEYLERTGQAPELPEELDGVPIKVEFISSMHQMQQQQGMGPIQNFLQHFAILAQLRPDIIDKVGFDAMVDELQRITGIRADTVLDQIEVDQIRQARAHQEQMQQQGMAMLAATEGMKNLGSTDPQNLQQNAGMFAPLMGGTAA